MSLYHELKALAESQLKTPTGPIYHYTNEDGYSEILKCEYLKLHSHIFINDKDSTNQELQTAIGLIIDELKKRKMNINTFLQHIYDNIIFYSVSFSTHRSLLTSYKYGNYCIEFNSNHINFKHNNSLTIFSDVEYDFSHQKYLISEIFKKYDQYKNNDNDATLELFYCLTLILPLLKTEENRDDCECRFILIEKYDLNKKKVILNQNSKKISFTKEDIITTYTYH